jgi:hypothetical protein
MERNRWQGFCGYCGAPVQPFEGVIDATGGHAGCQILCVEHAPQGALATPEAVGVSGFASVHGTASPS